MYDGGHPRRDDGVVGKQIEPLEDFGDVGGHVLASRGWRGRINYT